jgi:hypothetical protein
MKHTPDELAEVIKSDYRITNQRQMQQYVQLMARKTREHSPTIDFTVLIR